jgi:hypothetical protein
MHKHDGLIALPAATAGLRPNRVGGRAEQDLIQMFNTKIDIADVGSLGAVL